jgi:Na+-translocating ferredoxin:NAD+ oxidoreductase RnfD subunit
VRWDKIAEVRTILMVLAGLALISVSAFLWLVPVGYAVSGACLLLLAYLTDPAPAPRR